MGMFEIASLVSSSFLDYLMDVAPVVVLMGVVIFVQYRDNKQLNRDIRLAEKETLETMQSLTKLLEELTKTTDMSRDAVLNHVYQEVAHLREFIDNKLQLLQSRLNKND